MRLMLAVAVFSGLMASGAAACSCTHATPEQTFNSATAVFAGQVLAVRDTIQKDWFGRIVRPLGVIATVRVDLMWKGASPRQTLQLFVPESGACGFPLKIGELWLIYAAPVPLLPQLLQTNICARPSRLNPRGEDFLWLEANANSGP